MWAKEDFSNVKLETSESIKDELLKAKNVTSLYKKAIDILWKMEINFDDVLWNNTYDYFDWNVDVDIDKTEFEKKATIC